MGTRASAGRWVAVFAAGGLLCTLLDQLHVRTETLSYAHPDIAGQPWWVLPQFGVASIAVVAGAALMTSKSGGVTRTPSWRRLLASVAAFAGTYAASSYVNGYATLFVAASIGAWIALLAVRGDIKEALPVCVALAVGGPVYEGTLSSTGAFAYHQADLAGVPLWLPVLYLPAGLAAIDVARVSGYRPSLPWRQHTPDSSFQPR